MNLVRIKIDMTLKQAFLGSYFRNFKIAQETFFCVIDSDVIAGKHENCEIIIIIKPSLQKVFYARYAILLTLFEKFRSHNKTLEQSFSTTIYKGHTYMEIYEKEDEEISRNYFVHIFSNASFYIFGEGLE